MRIVRGLDLEIGLQGAPVVGVEQLFCGRGSKSLEPPLDHPGWVRVNNGHAVCHFCQAGLWPGPAGNHHAATISLSASTPRQGCNLAPDQSASLVNR